MKYKLLIDLESGVGLKFRDSVETNGYIGVDLFTGSSDIYDCSYLCDMYVSTEYSRLSDYILNEYSSYYVVADIDEGEERVYLYTKSVKENNINITVKRVLRSRPNKVLKIKGFIYYLKDE